MSIAVLGLTLWMHVAGSAAVSPRQTPDVRRLVALSVEAVGECPRQDAVMAALLSVVGKDALGRGREAPRVSDLGDRFEVTAAGQTGQYVDPGRDCVERARVAAVFIALALNPPTVQSVRAPPSPPDGAPAAASPSPSSSTARWAELAAGARIDGASAGDGSIGDLAFGGEARGAVGWGALGVSAGAGVLTSTTRPFGSVSVRQRRFPFSIAAKARTKVFDSLEVGADLGVSLVLLTLRGEGLERVDPAVRLDAGARLSFEVRFVSLARSVVPFVEIHGELFPRPYVFAVDPLGEIGTTHRLWLGASAGASFGW